MNLAQKLIAVFLFLFITSAHAQISLKGIKNKASNAMEDALERKIEQEMNKAAQRVVDKYWDRVLGKYYSGLYDDSGNLATGSGGHSGSPSGTFPFVMNENVEIEDAYSFNHAVRMQIDTYKKNGKLDETVFLVNHTNHDHAYVGTSIEDAAGKQEENIFIINDFENNALIMLMDNDGEKMRLAYSITINEEAAAEMMEEMESEDGSGSQEVPAFETIGTKDILGYPCKGYKQDTEDMTNEVWLAHKDVFGMNNIFGARGMDTDHADEMIAAGYPEGSIMEWTSYDKDTKEKTTMTVVEIDDNIEISYDMIDYPSSAELQESSNE